MFCLTNRDKLKKASFLLEDQIINDINKLVIKQMRGAYMSQLNNFIRTMIDIKLTPQLSAFILNVKKYISQKKLSLDEFFFEIKLSNPKRITQQQFLRIVQRINESGLPVNTTLLFTELSKGSPVIARETFVTSFFKVFKIDRIHLQGQSMCLKPKASTIIQKLPSPVNPIEEQNKRIALFGFTRLKHHMASQKQKLDKIFNDCDINKSGSIDKLELNKLLFASGIKQFKDKNVRRLLVYHVFDDLLKKEFMGKEQFFSLFQFRKELKSNSIKREAKTNTNNHMRRSQVKTIKYQYTAQNTPPPLRKAGGDYYVIKVRPNHKIITINQPGDYYNPEDEDINDYINDYLDDLPAYNPRFPDPYGYDPMMPDPYDYDDMPQIKPKRPKKPKIQPINPIYDNIDDPIYDDPYGPQDPYNDPYGQDDIYDNPKIKPKKPKIRPVDPYNNINNNNIKKKKQQANVDRPKFEIGKNKENNVRAYPNAGKYYRLGIPPEEDKPYIQELQRLLSSNKAFEDNKNPKTNGEYVPCKEIFDQPFQLIEMSPEDMNSQRQDLKIGKFIQANDVNQGETGDCYFLCAIGSVAAQYPQLLSQLFLFEVNPASYYGVKLFVDGEWKILKTDDLFVCKPHGGDVMYAKPNNNEIWVMLLEKCFAKIYGSFKAINGGQESQAFFALTGAPSHTIYFKQQKSQQAIKDRILNAGKKGYLMATAGTEYLSSLSEAKRQQIGLVSGHAYSMIFVREIKGGVTLVKLRNPWGRFQWKGDWSYDSNLWTPQLRNELDYNSKYEDGTFFMSWEDYYKYFGLFAICKVNPMHVHTSLRMLNNNHRSNYIRMNVVKEGVYDIFIAQQAERRYSNQNYRCSNARVIVLREGPNGKYEYAGSSSQMNPVCNAEVRLTPGSYIISAKVQWLLWDDHECFLNAYGVQKVTFQKLDRNIAPQFKQSIFPGFALANRKNAKIGSYADSGNPGIQTETHLSPSDGLGYVKTINKTNRPYSIRVNYAISGMKIATQNNKSYVMNLRPGGEDLLGFFVNSMGYHFTFSYQVK